MTRNVYNRNRAIQAGDRVILLRYFQGFEAGTIFIAQGSKQKRKYYPVPVLHEDRENFLRIPNKLLELLED